MLQIVDRVQNPNHNAIVKHGIKLGKHLPPGNGDPQIQGLLVKEEDLGQPEQDLGQHHKLAHIPRDVFSSVAQIHIEKFGDDSDFLVHCSSHPDILKRHIHARLASFVELVEDAALDL